MRSAIKQTKPPKRVRAGHEVVDLHSIPVPPPLAVDDLPSFVLVPPTAGRPWSGERRLALAVLEDAIRVLGKYRGRGGEAGELWADTMAWVESDAEASPFDFVLVCATVGIDASWLRRGLRERMGSLGQIRTVGRRSLGRIS